MSISRRSFFKIAGLAGGAGLLGMGKKARAIENFTGWPDRFGVLTDLSKCIGCRSCEEACNREHKLPEPETPFEDQSIFENKRRTSAGAFTVVNRFQNPENGKKPVFVKSQCMHCNEPACASACLVKAFKKTPEGAVRYNENICIGCRYCMTACPFYVPAYEYDSAFSPRVRKCNMCFQRISRGAKTACVEACPTEALILGKREDLIRIARSRIANDAEYVDHIYGENEVGGTSWMYISKEPFENLGFNMDLGTTPYPNLSYGFLWSVPIVLTAWPVFLTGCYMWSKRSKEIVEEERR